MAVRHHPSFIAPSNLKSDVAGTVTMPVLVSKAHAKSLNSQATWKDGSLVLEGPSAHAVNVSSVPLRSPFRYPGGKTWLIPSVRRWLASVRFEVEELIEPFAGGGTVGLTAAFEGLARSVTLVELDDDVASVWETMLGSDAGWLSRHILDFELTDRTIRRILSREPKDRKEQAFSTLLQNRINRGGILAPGAGKSKYGEKGKGLASRWYPETLSDRILAINSVNDRLHFVRADGLAVLRGNSRRKDVAFFIDPPYTAGGKQAGLRLYRHAVVDHPAIFDAASSIAGDFLMTYDDAEEVRAMADSRGFDMNHVPMKSTHHAEMTELLIGRDLAWTRGRTLDVGSPEPSNGV